MYDEDFWCSIAVQISQVSGENFTVKNVQSISGGCISLAYVIRDDHRCYFIKLNEAARHEMFVAEFQGLEEMAKTHTVRIPRPLCYGITNGSAWLVMEYIETGAVSGNSMANFGRQLAMMHQVEQPWFGWHMDNTIGSTRQINSVLKDWSKFWCQQRLKFQFDLAFENGFCGRLQKRSEMLMELCPQIFEGRNIQPSLLHGDLWSGNFLFDREGRAVIFDPAVYYGDRETDLAMTELFGGYTAQFYKAYFEVYPVDEAYALRKILYNLYHILNHLNLFGEGYLMQAQQMIDQLLAELR